MLGIKNGYIQNRSFPKMKVFKIFKLKWPN